MKLGNRHLLPHVDLFLLVLLWVGAVSLPLAVFAGTWEAAAIGAVLAITVYNALLAHKRHLEARLAGAGVASVWQVWSQGERLAQLPDRDIAAICRQVNLDFRTHLAQLYCTLKTVASLVWLFLQTLPIAGFWVLVYLHYEGHLASLATASLADLFDATRNAMTVALVAYAVIAPPFIVHRFRNVFAERLASEVARRVHAPSMHVDLKRMPC